MPPSKIRKVTRVGKRSLCVVIPSAFAQDLGWTERQKVIVSYSARGKKVIISEIDAREGANARH
jgi:bifunctional DNA-binding transcriptional regulator/antitoxin component of YhaV-PrlF toxin-antitoxin module